MVLGPIGMTGDGAYGPKSHTIFYCFKPWLLMKFICSGVMGAPTLAWVASTAMNLLFLTFSRLWVATKCLSVGI